MTKITFSWFELRRSKVARSFMLLLTLLAAGIPSAIAGNGDSHLGLHAGISYPRILSVQLSYTKENRYHDAYDFYVDAFTQWKQCPTCGKVCKDTFWKNCYGLTVGGTFKPAVHRGRNNVGRVRLGADLGTNTRSFMAGVELGYEHVWTLRSGVQLVLQQRNEFNFWAKPTFVNGIQAGVRLPLSF